MTLLKLSNSPRRKKRRLVSKSFNQRFNSFYIDFNLEEDDVQDEAELVESLLEEFDEM